MIYLHLNSGSATVTVTATTRWRSGLTAGKIARLEGPLGRAPPPGPQGPYMRANWPAHLRLKTCLCSGTIREVDPPIELFPFYLTTHLNIS